MPTHLNSIMCVEQLPDRGLKANRHGQVIGGLLLMLLLTSLASPYGLTTDTGQHGRVELLAQQAAVMPGRPFWVGFHFQLEPGWHIYWINPGDSGEPPKVNWKLPPEFREGPLEWPVPSRIEDHSLVDYGYQNQVLLPVEIRPPAGQSRNPQLRIGASVKWLVCRDVCLPEHADLSLTVRVSPGMPAHENPLFSHADAHLPRTPPKSWRVAAKLDQHRFVLNVITGGRETSASFFPLEPNQIENAAPQTAHPLARGISIELQKSDQLLKTPAHLKGVLVLASG